MQKLFFFALFLAACAIGFHAARAQSVSLIHGIAFGNFAPTTGGGSVTITPEGTVIHDNLIDLGGTRQAGEILATGTPEAAFGVSYGGGSVLLTSGSDTMTLTSFIDNAPMTFDITGQATFNVGATLVVGAVQPLGIYSGDLTITVNYE